MFFWKVFCDGYRYRGGVSVRGENIQFCCITFCLPFFFIQFYSHNRIVLPKRFPFCFLVAPPPVPVCIACLIMSQIQRLKKRQKKWKHAVKMLRKKIKCRHVYRYRMNYMQLFLIRAGSHSKLLNFKAKWKTEKVFMKKSWLSYLMSREWGLRDKAGHERKWNVWEWQSPQSHLRTLTTSSCLPSLSNLLLPPSPLSLPVSFKTRLWLFVVPLITQLKKKDTVAEISNILQIICPLFYCIFAFY